MLKPYKIEAYCKEYKPLWACDMPIGCPPEDIAVPYAHIFYRLARQSECCTEDDFLTYAEKNPSRDWGDQLPLAVGLSVIDNESKARRNMKLPYFRAYKGIISIELNPTDGVVKQTGVHTSHYTWWRTRAFRMDNLKMLPL